MSLSRRPSGLPSNPRARTSLPGQERPDPIPRPRSAASERPPPSSYQAAPPPLPQQARNLRSQRSVEGLPSGPAKRTGSVRSRSLDRRAEPRHAPSRSDPPPPIPRLPSQHRGGRVGITQERSYGNAHSSTRSVDRSAYRGRARVEVRLSDSASSSGASDAYLSPGSIASSRTSLDERDMYDNMDDKAKEGFGSSLWTNITGVASNLTISVSKAWSQNVATYSGEETPVGGESRLARAMKAYHIEKARDPADLPVWLFDERERGVRSRQTTSGARETKPAQAPQSNSLSRSVTTVRREEDPLPPPRINRGPTLADRKASSNNTMGSLSGSGGEAHVTKSISRLRELRDAKRNAKVRFGGDMEDEQEIPAPRPPMPPVPPMPIAEPVMARERYPPPTRPRGMAAPLGASLGGRGRQPVGLPSGVRPVRA